MATSYSVELLLLNDPLLPRVRRAAQHGKVPSHRWLEDSARHWAVREFVRREDYRERLKARGEPVKDFDVDEELRRFARHQVAVLLDYVQAQGERAVERVRVGFLYDGCHAGYVQLGVAGGERLAGIMTVLDVCELPLAYQLRQWPYDL